MSRCLTGCTHTHTHKQTHTHTHTHKQQSRLRLTGPGFFFSLFYYLQSDCQVMFIPVQSHLSSRCHPRMQTAELKGSAARDSSGFLFFFFFFGVSLTSEVNNLNSCWCFQFFFFFWWPLCFNSARRPRRPLCETHQIKYFCFGSVRIHSRTPAKGVIIKSPQTIAHFYSSW